MDEAERARFDRLISTWRASAAEVLAFLREVPADRWSTPSELTGWTVHDLAAHLAHLEGLTAGFPQTQVEVPDAPHLTSRFAKFTEAGVIARRGAGPADLIDELERAVESRAAFLQQNPPASLTDRGDSLARLTGWTWETLLGNRIVDLWMHEQDIRRPLGLPGNLETAGARHTSDMLAGALAFVTARPAAAPAGTSVRWEATGPGAVTVVAVVGDDGRGRLVPPDSIGPPTVTVRMPFSEWVRRSGGRGADDTLVEVTGDADIARDVLTHLTVTP